MRSKKQWAAWQRFKKSKKIQPTMAEIIAKATQLANISEVIVSTEDMRKITWAWLYEPAKPQRKQRLFWLMLLYSNPDVKDLASKLGIPKEQLLEALEEIPLCNPVN